MAKNNSPENKDAAQDAVTSQVNAATFSQAKEDLKQVVQRTGPDTMGDEMPEAAIEVIDQRTGGRQPIKRAFIAEHLFRRTIEDAIPCGIAAVDNDGRQIYVNRTFCRMLGWDEEELIGTQYPYSYWDPEDVKTMHDSYALVRSGSVPPGGLELPFLRKDRHKIWGWVLGSRIYDSEGRRAGHLIALMDISRRKEVESDLRRLSSRLVDAQELERKRVSLDLHDCIGGRLAGIKYGMEKIVRSIPKNQTRMAGPLNDLLKVVKATIVETQRLSRNLHPSVIDDLGLTAALRDLVREFRMLYPAITVTSDIAIDTRMVAEHLRILIYRVCQEALTNIGKHSHASKVVVRLHHRDKEVILTVEDNGIGMADRISANGPDAARHLGLLNMRERTDLVGGRLEVNSQKGKGVCIKALWPSGLAEKGRF